MSRNTSQKKLDAKSYGLGESLIPLFQQTPQYG